MYDSTNPEVIVDFTFVHLNAAAKRMLGLATDEPALTLLQLLPQSQANGAFTFHREAFITNEPLSFDLTFQTNGQETYFRASARRVGEGLVVSFVEAADHPRMAMRIALRETQAREQAARAEAEVQRQQLQLLFMQAPACMANLTGPDHVFSFVNPPYSQLFSGRPLVGKPFTKALPEMKGQPFLRWLDEVYRTGKTHFGNEVLAYVDHTNTGRLEERYFNFIYQATRDASDAITGVLIFAYDVSEQVERRRRLEEQEHQTNQLNEELAAANEELHASFEEIRANNEALAHTELALRSLNQELEARVEERTQEVQLAQIETERQRMRLYRFFMQAPAALCSLDGPNLVFELINPNFQSLFPGRRIQGHSLLEALPELKGHRAWNTLRLVYDTGATHQETAILIPVAEYEGGPLEDRYFNYVQQARYDSRGDIDGVLVFAFEVTEQVKAQQQSEESARRLRILTDALPVLIGYLDNEQRYQFANQAYETWFNQRPADLLGRTVKDIVGEEAYRQVQHYIERALAGERLDFEAQMPYRENFTKYIRTSYVPDVQKGQVAGFYTLVNDITEQVEARQQVQRLNEQLLSMNEELQTSNEELSSTNEQLTRTNVDLDNFIYTASHDLKAPITNIEGLLQVLLNELPTNKREGDVGYVLELMQGAVDRFKRTIEHLTDVSKLQKEHAQPATQVSLAKVVQDVRLDLMPLIQETGAQLTLDTRNCPSIAFSEKNLRSVVYNLLSNALKYHHPDRIPEVHLHCRTEGPYLVLEVQDNGLGLDLTRTQHMFQMFQRYHTHVEGSGVGLYMVKKMVENTGGQIQVQSKLGEGSTFSVYFCL
ncbi:PAS domain-containing protein [Hymenobacter wooponensis]|uniref:histidine kinase n=1 Tax=Hymenobacter wooponensis TaxID=1525360 RepID=A0A4Z0MEA2_9BACT|nr:PAS domain-containing protein [Hymenobacter wooponensis]TGD77799.1 PAS domain S-box protein [Hymenobacter wooponensis]